MKFCTLKLELKAVVQNGKLSSACDISSEAIYPSSKTNEQQQQKNQCFRSLSKLLTYTVSDTTRNTKAQLHCWFTSKATRE